MDKNRKLGKGLEALLNSGIDNFENNDKLIKVSINDIIPGKYQPRVKINNDSLLELTQSIKSKGLIQPIIVRQKGLFYEIIAGERRWRASKLAKLKEIPVIIKSLNDEESLAIGLIENLQREDLNPIDEAYALKKLVDEFNLTHDNIAKIIGRSRSFITNSLRLISLPSEIKDMVINNLLSIGHVRAVLTLSLDQQLALARLAIKNKLSVSQLEKISKDSKNINNKINNNSEFIDLQNKLSIFTGMKVLISTNKRSNKLIFSFKDNYELNKILNILGYK